MSKASQHVMAYGINESTKGASGNKDYADTDADANANGDADASGGEDAV